MLIGLLLWMIIDLLQCLAHFLYLISSLSSPAYNLWLLSSTKAKYQSLAQLSADIIWLQSLLQQIKFALLFLLCMYCDNLIAQPCFAGKHKTYEIGLVLCQGNGH